MNVAVCLKCVPDSGTVEIDPLSGAIDTRRLLYRLNPADESALELALQLQGSDGSVAALTVGPPYTESVLREALAAGAAQVLRLWDDGWSETAPVMTARLLATALRAGNLPDLVLCGVRSADRGTGQVPAMLAEFLGWPVVCDVTHLELFAGRAVVQRRLEMGLREQVEVTLPVVLALEPDLARLRHASLTQLLASRQAQIPVLRPSDLGLSTANLEQISAQMLPTLLAVLPPRPRPRAIFVPDSALNSDERIDQILSAGVIRKSGQVLEGPPDEMVAAILHFLHQRGFLEQPPGEGTHAKS